MLGLSNKNPPPWARHTRKGEVTMNRTEGNGVGLTNPEARIIFTMQSYADKKMCGEGLLYTLDFSV